MTTTTTPTSDLSVHLSEAPSASRMRDAFTAFSAGDLDIVRASFAPDAVWINGGSSPLAGEHRGWEAISAMFGTLMKITDGTFSMKVISIVGDDHNAIAVYDTTSTVKGVTQTQRVCLVDELTPDGLVRSARMLPYDAVANDAHLNR